MNATQEKSSEWPYRKIKVPPIEDRDYELWNPRTGEIQRCSDLAPLLKNATVMLTEGDEVKLLPVKP